MLLEARLPPSKRGRRMRVGRERGRWWAARRGMEAQEVLSWYLVDEREEHLVF